MFSAKTILTTPILTGIALIVCLTIWMALRAYSG